MQPLVSLCHEHGQYWSNPESGRVGSLQTHKLTPTLATSHTQGKDWGKV